MTSQARVRWRLLALVLGALAAACGGPELKVAFLTVPQAVQSNRAESCGIVSRSPISHIMRVALTPEADGRATRIDNAVVRVRVRNVSRGNELANVDLKPDGQPHELTLSGKADVGDQLELSGGFSANGDLRKFSQTCLID